MKKIRIFIAEDHQLLVDTWTILLNNDPRFEVTGSCNNSEEVFSLVEICHPDIVLMDINMQPVDGFKLTAQIRKIKPPPEVIGITLHSIPAFAKRLLAIGAKGYITKNSPREEMTEAIVAVYSGKRYICREIKDKWSAAALSSEPSLQTWDNLTRRELEIIHYICRGFTSREIAKEISIAAKTVEVHRYNVMKKLQLMNVAELVNLAMQRNL